MPSQSKSGSTQNDLGYLGDCVDQVYKSYQKSSVPGYLDDLDDNVDQNLEKRQDQTT